MTKLELTTWLNEKVEEKQSQLNSALEKKEKSTWTYFLEWRTEMIIQHEQELLIFKELLEFISESKTDDIAIKIINKFVHSLRKEIIYGSHIERSTSAVARLIRALTNEAKKEVIENLEMAGFVERLT